MLFKNTIIPLDHQLVWRDNEEDKPGLCHNNAIYYAGGIYDGTISARKLAF